LRFDSAAELFVGEATPDEIKGISTPSERYKLQVSKQKDGIVFVFRDEGGHFGTLFLH
jgi:hypothetical protein